MNLSTRIDVFVELGHKLANWDSERLELMIAQAKSANGWFVDSEVKRALKGIIKMLSREQLEQWTKGYKLDGKSPKKVGIVMAGNIPFVGFHDLLSVLISGHHAEAKLSSQDQVLMRSLIAELKEIAPDFVINEPEKLNDADAMIATGSDNSARYFEYYFRNKPNIIRKNRTSVAFFTGDETVEDFQMLAKDIFSYFGLGCRNISKIYHPEGFDFTQMLKNFEDHEEIIHHNKYRNNYDYNKSILLVNRVDHLDSGFLLLQENENLVSPISVLFTEPYKNAESGINKIKSVSEKIQCVTTKQTLTYQFERGVPYGEAQNPEVWDYADGVDSLAFLQEL